MALCNLCSNIPWENLPTIPLDLGRGLTGQPFIQPVYRWPTDLRGHPHHQSLEAVRQSALTCNLCHLIYQSAQKVQGGLEELKPKWEAGDARKYPWPTWEMFLVKRRAGGDGCWVMTFVKDDRPKRRKDIEEAWIVAALGICVEDGDPLDSVIEGRPIDPYGGGPKTLARARRWLQECDEHDSCSPGDKQLPSRVIDVGLDVSSPQVRLWQPVPEGTLGKYVSLSYCWGNSREFVTTISSLEERKRGITIADMPLTYQHVITLTRALGIRYLWVDSLCICQDDGEDWERESARMLSIYSNAYVTVAASASKNSAEGLFRSRPTREYVHLKYTREGIEGTAMAFSLPMREELIDNEYISKPHEPLSTRAWSLQERVLSRRSLIFGIDQTSYECHEGFRAEDGLTLSQQYFTVHKSRRKKLAHESEAAKTEQTEQTDALKEWFALIGQYGPRKLTRASDKLPAISGLARIFSERIGEDYTAGLWRGHLLECLMWQGLGFRRVTEYRAPSWSWASGDGTAAAHIPNNHEKIAEIVDVNVSLKGLNPFGEVSDGRITLRAPMEQLYFILDNWDPEKPGHVPYENNIKVRTSNGDKEGAYSRLDFAFTHEDAPQEAKKLFNNLKDEEIFALVLYKTISASCRGTGDCTSYHSLIVQKIRETGEYRRVGFLLEGEAVLGFKPEERPTAELPVIVLV